MRPSTHLVRLIVPGVFALVACAGLPQALPAPPESSLARIQRELAQREYWASENARGLQAPNRAQGLRTYFASDGIRVVDREDPASPELSGLRLAAWGREGALARAGQGALDHANERVEIRRPGLVEWFVNGPHGLEHGFTVETRPVGEGELVLELATEAARAHLSSDAVLLDTGAGRKLRYGKLAAFDAKGITLAARFEVPAPDRVQLIVSDAGAAYPLSIDPLLTTLPARLESNQASASFGGSVASADVNGDGYDDVIVGAPLYDAGETNEGAAFLFLGSAAGIADGSPASANAELESNQAEASFGGSVGSADVNGDGYDDVIVGAHRYDIAQDLQGAAFIFHGSATGIADGNPGTANARLDSNQMYLDSFPAIASRAGDVNGDGYDDVIIGDSAYTAGQDFEGAAFVFLGSATGIASGPVSSAQARIESDQVGANMGSVSFAGDVNGDGYGDVIVGAPGYDGASSIDGAAFVFLGSATGIGNGHVFYAHAQITSMQVFAQLGTSVASAGDVNGDGYSDVIVGCGLCDAGQNNEGEALLFLGSATGIKSGARSSASARLEGNQASAQFGSSVAPAGDVNGDGYSDVIVGAKVYDAGESDEGAAFVFLGSASGMSNADPSTAYAQLQSNQASANFGVSVSAADVNGDGRSDLIVGASSYDAGETDEGEAFIYDALPEPGRPALLFAGAAALLALRKRRMAAPR